LGEVEIEFVGNGSPDERPGITLVFADQAIEENKSEPWVPLIECFDRSDHLPDALSLFVDSPIAKDPDFPSRLPRQRKKYLRVYPARSSVTPHLIFSLDPPADTFGTAEVIKVPAGDIFLLLVALKDEIEEFCPGSEAFELREDRIFAGDTDFEILGPDRLKGPDLPPEL
jgi:hypothetical protein